MTKELVIERLTKAGFTPEDKGDSLSVPLGEAGIVRFPFAWKKLDNEAEELAKAAAAFAKDFDEHTLYAVKISMTTGLSPQEVTELPPEEFDKLMEEGVIANARGEVREIKEQANKLAKITKELNESFAAGD